MIDFKQALRAARIPGSTFSQLVNHSDRCTIFVSAGVVRVRDGHFYAQSAPGSTWWWRTWIDLSELARKSIAVSLPAERRELKPKRRFVPTRKGQLLRKRKEANSKGHSKIGEEGGG